MAKKKAKNKQKFRKQLQLQRLAASQSGNAEAGETATAAVLLEAAPVRPVLETDHHLFPEIKRTLVSLSIVALLLTGATIFSHKTNHLQTFGTWLFHFLRLNS